MLEDNVRGIDAVMVATTGHHLAPCSAVAMKLGKPVYCEKPLTQSVAEARQIRRIANQTGVPTQMGNQGTATDAFREQVEIYQTGGLGEVREVYVWQRMGNAGIQESPAGEERPPASLAWDLWLGPRAYRPYNRHWTRWSAWRDFGFGQLGNWGSHATAAAFRGLKLDTLWDAEATGAPRIRVRPKSGPTNALCFPAWEAIDFELPARGDMPPVTIHWFAGDGAPGFPENIEALSGTEVAAAGSGCLAIGSRGKIRASGHNSAYSVLPGERRNASAGRSRTCPVTAATNGNGSTRSAAR
jgi:predicted dehydrogenase